MTDSATSHAQERQRRIREWARRQLRRLPFDLALLSCALVAVHCYQTRNLVSGFAPPIETTDLDNVPVRMGASVGRPTLVYFWATWCGVCRAEQGAISALARDHHVLAVASRSGDSLEVRGHVEEHGFQVPVITDTDGTLARRYGVQAFPSMFFVDAAGRIVTSEVGYTTELGLRLRMGLAELRAQAR